MLYAPKKYTNIRLYILYFIQVSLFLFFFSAPFIITNNGHNLIRFDLNKLQIYFFNSIITFNNFFNISIFVLALVFLFILTAQVFGRIWCGWLCPQSLCSDFILYIASIFKKRKTTQKAIIILMSAVVAFVLSLGWFFLFISPYDLSEFLGSDSVRTGFIIFSVIFIALFLDFAFIRYEWCKYLCPYSKFQSLMSDSDTLYVGMLNGKDSECIKCLACVKACPIEIDARQNPQSECIGCEKCIRACDNILSKREKDSILGYQWGKSDKFDPFRPNLIITFLIFLLLSFIFCYNIIENKPFKVDIISIKQIEYNTYVIDMKIKSNESLSADIYFDVIPHEDAVIDPNLVSFSSKGKKRAELTLKIKNEDDLNKIRLKIRSNKGYERIIEMDLKNREEKK